MLCASTFHSKYSVNFPDKTKESTAHLYVQLMTKKKKKSFYFFALFFDSEITRLISFQFLTGKKETVHNFDVHGKLADSSGICQKETATHL